MQPEGPVILVIIILFPFSKLKAYKAANDKPHAIIRYEEHGASYIQRKCPWDTSWWSEASLCTCPCYILLF